MKYIALLLLCFGISVSMAQPNCNVYEKGTPCYKGCKSAWRAIMHPQGSYRSQQLFDSAIDQCPQLAYAYMEKAVPYLKRGQFVAWKQLIDKAVELEPLQYLGYRGWCRLQFLRDYKGAIADIEELLRITKGDIGFCQTGDYHLEVALALCYSELGQPQKARQIMQSYVDAKYYSEGLYDYYQFGIIEFKLGNYRAAITHFQQQIATNEIAEAHYFLALASKKLGNMDGAKVHLAKAKEGYKMEHTIYDNYTEPIGKIYLSDIENELNAL